MGLTASLLASKTVKTSGGEFAVRGLSLNDIVSVFGTHRQAIEDLFNRIFVVDGGKVGMAEEVDVDMIIATVVGEAPLVAASIIATAADSTDDEGFAVALRLPGPVQIAALMAVAELTFTTEMPPKKVLEIVIQLATGAQKSLLGLGQ